MDESEYELVRRRLPRLEDLDRVLAALDDSAPERESLLALREQAQAQHDAFYRISEDLLVSVFGTMEDAKKYGFLQENPEHPDFANFKSDPPTLREMLQMLRTLAKGLADRGRCLGSPQKPCGRPDCKTCQPPTPKAPAPQGAGAGAAPVEPETGSDDPTDPDDGTDPDDAGDDGTSG